MALNQLHLLPQFDWVVYLEEGQVAAQGRSAEVTEAAARLPRLSTPRLS